MEIPISTVIVLLMFHTFSDFFAQTQWQAENKSHNLYALFSHVRSYTVSFMLPLYIYGLWGMETNLTTLYDFLGKFLIFSAVTFVAHFVTDYTTSKLTTKYWKEERWRNFFKVVGVDQFLHIVQILITYYLVFLR